MHTNQSWGIIQLPVCSLTVCWGVGCRLLAKFTSFQNTASILSKINFQGHGRISLLSVPCLCAHCSTWLAMCDDTAIKLSHWHVHAHTCTHTYQCIQVLRWRRLVTAWTIRKLMKMVISSVTERICYLHLDRHNPHLAILCVYLGNITVTNRLRACVTIKN